MKRCIAVLGMGLGLSMWGAIAAAQMDDLPEGEEGGEDAEGDGATAEASWDAPAGEASLDEADPQPGSGIQMSAGLKIGGGGNLLVAPDNAPLNAAPFDEGVGGYAFTIGPYVEARFLDGLLGFQTGLIFDLVTNMSQIDISGVQTDWGWSATDLRIPLLLQLGTPGEGTRLFVTTGPEVVVGLSASPDFQSDPPVFAPSVFEMQTTTRANWVVGLGLASNLSVLRLTFDLQFAYNLGVPSTYGERVGLLLNGVPVGNPNLTPASGGVLGVSTEAQTNMDLRLLLGVGYDFGNILD